jgi:hypothetical protein
LKSIVAVVLLLVIVSPVAPEAGRMVIGCVAFTQVFTGKVIGNVSPELV